jgi:hypothetical protein
MKRTAPSPGIDRRALLATLALLPALSGTLAGAFIKTPGARATL